MNPIHEWRQFRLDNPKRNVMVKEKKDTAWNGDCWKAWVKLRSRGDLNMFVVDTDFGCGVISFGEQEILDVQKENLTYFNLQKNRKEWLNLISAKEFIKKCT